MEQVFQKNLKNLQLNKNHKLLLATSGGVDSMVLLDLCLTNNLKVSIAHGNFQLRGEESNKDEQFLLDFSQEHNLEIHTQKFDVKKYKQSGNYSTQIAARNLRYNWFNELINQYKYDFLLTAHHLNDSLETFIINLSRGTGISGLTGIPTENEKIKRPLYNITKQEILTYAKEHKITWREDESNGSDNYVRNKIRHHISPILEELHPTFHQNFLKTINVLKNNQQLLDNYFAQLKQQLFVTKNKETKILINDLIALNPLETQLFHLFSSYGFHHPKEIIKLLHAKTGSEIQSTNYRLIKNREELLLLGIEFEKKQRIPVLLGENSFKSLNLRLIKKSTKDLSATEVIDFDKVQFPLHIRNPKVGDEFRPLHMKGTKKLSKYFKDLKLSKLDKESVQLLCDANDQIIWLIGYRLDDQFKINNNTKQFLNIYYVE